MKKLSVFSFMGMLLFLNQSFGSELQSKTELALSCQSGTKQLLVQKFQSRTNSSGLTFWVSGTDTQHIGDSILTPEEVKPYSDVDSYGYLGNSISIYISRDQSLDLPFGKVRASIRIYASQPLLWLCSL